MSGAESNAKKQVYFTKLVKLLDEYTKILIVGVDNVGSNQMQVVRKNLRGKAVVLMGKNTLIRKVIRGHTQNNPALENLLPHIRGNIGFVFVKDDLVAVKKVIAENKVPAAAKAGALAPCDVIVPKGNTGLEPTQTSFFQALNIPSKITKGQIEIINDVPLITAGNRVGPSEANLLLKLDIKPFQYGFTLLNVYDNGAIYDPKVLDLTDDDIISKFRNGVRNIASIGLAIGYPTVASLPHSIIRGFKNVLSISLATSYKIKQAELLTSASTAPPPTKETKKEAPKKEQEKPKEKEKEKEKSEDDDMGFGLFD